MCERAEDFGLSYHFASSVSFSPPVSCMGSGLVAQRVIIIIAVVTISRLYMCAGNYARVKLQPCAALCDTKPIVKIS